MISIEDFYPPPPIAPPRCRRVVLVPKNRLAEILVGKARIANLPPGFRFEATAQFERFADYLSVGVIVEHSSFGVDPGYIDHSRFMFPIIETISEKGGSAH